MQVWKKDGEHSIARYPASKITINIALEVSIDRLHTVIRLP